MMLKYVYVIMDIAATVNANYSTEQLMVVSKGEGVQYDQQAKWKHCQSCLPQHGIPVQQFVHLM